MYLLVGVKRGPLLHICSQEVHVEPLLDEISKDGERISHNPFLYFTPEKEATGSCSEMMFTIYCMHITFCV